MLYSLRISLGLVFPLSNDVSLFFIFILLFWNHILMCFSDRLRDFASSILRALVMYRLNRNSFSNSTCCLVVYAVLARERTVAELQDSRPRPLGLSSAVKKKNQWGTAFSRSLRRSNFVRNKAGVKIVKATKYYDLKTWLVTQQKHFQSSCCRFDSWKIRIHDEENWEKSISVRLTFWRIVNQPRIKIPSINQ